MSKFNNKKSCGFDSKIEKTRYDFLKMLEKSGTIKNLKTQVEFTLLEPFRDRFFGVTKSGEYKTCRGVKYIADFTYEAQNAYSVDTLYIEDVKGFKTRDYIIKRNFLLSMLAKMSRELNMNIEFAEITKENAHKI